MSVLRAGATIGKYEIVGVLGAGGMGVVYEARHPVLASRLVIKTLRSNLQGAGAQMAERFRNEALAASRLRDDRLPQIFDIDELPDGTQYLVMELLEGEDLASRLARGPLPSGYACRIMLEVLEVLAKVHRLGIVHRDIKPANIFLARSDLFGEIPKLLDFGVAHIVNVEVTPAGILLGTPAYMAPEQALGDGPIRAATDVFSAGVVLFELIAGMGTRPWPQESAAAYHRALADNEPPRQLGSVARSPPGLSQVITRALARYPADRYIDATAFARALEPYADERSALHRSGVTRAGGSAIVSPAASANAVQPTALATASDAMLETAAAGRAPEKTSLAPQASSVRPRDAVVSGQKVAQIRLTMDRFRQSKLRAAPPIEPQSARLQPGERRHVTVVFVDTQLFQTGSAALSSEDTEHLMLQFTSLFSDELRERGAQVQAQPDAGLLAVFGFNEVREDDSERAVAAAFAVHRRRAEANDALTEIGYALTCRIGIHRGFATRVGGADQQAPNTGDVLSIARRLAEHAPINGVVGSGDLVALVGDAFSTRRAGRVSLKGRAEVQVESHEILGAAHPGWEDSIAGQSARGTTRGSEPSSASLGAGFWKSTPFVGRDAEIARLREIVTNARSRGRHPSVVLVTGAAGTGKTRLVTELFHRFGTDTSPLPRVVRVQPQTGTTYGLWAGLAAALLARGAEPIGPEDDIEAALGDLCSTLEPERARLARAQAPALRLLFGGPAEAAEDEESPAAMVDRIEKALQLCVEGAARKAAPNDADAPLVLALENLHRADLASLELLPKVLGGLRGSAQPLVILTARDAGAVDVSRLPGTAAFSVGPLDRASVEALASLLAGEEISEPVRAFIAQRAAGNPLFVEELVHTLRANRMLSASAEKLRSFTPPTSLYGMLLERVDRLSAPLRDVLRIASVLGVEFERALYVEVARAGVGPEALGGFRRPEEALDELSRLGLIDTSAGHDGGALHAFRPAQLQGAVYGTVLVENKRILHGLAADAIASIYGDRSGPQLSRILFHVTQTDDVQRTLDCARAAGQRALGLCASSEAIEDLELAVQLQSQRAEASPVPAARTMHELASAYLHAGKLGPAAKRAREAAELIAAGLRDPSLPDAVRREMRILEARVALTRSEASYHRPDWEACVGLLEQAEEAFTAAGLPVDAAAAKCGRGFILRALGRHERGLAVAREGWEGLKDSQALATIAHAGHDLGNVMRDAGLPAESIAIFDRSIAAGEELHRRGSTLESVWGRLASRSGRAMAFEMMGRLDEAIADQSAARELAIREHHPVAHAVTEYHLANHHLARGDLAEADAMAASSLKLSREMGMASRVLKCHFLQAKIAERRGDPAAALRCLEDAEAFASREDLSDEVWMGAAEALVAALRRSGQTDRAEELGREALRRAGRTGGEKLLARAEAVARGG
ncbi:MAG: AAA family ATPase [Polyangiaceae bacterium]